MSASLSCGPRVWEASHRTVVSQYSAFGIGEEDWTRGQKGAQSRKRSRRRRSVPTRSPTFAPPRSWPLLDFSPGRPAIDRLHLVFLVYLDFFLIFFRFFSSSGSPGTSIAAACLASYGSCLIFLVIGNLYVFMDCVLMMLLWSRRWMLRIFGFWWGVGVWLIGLDAWWGWIRLVSALNCLIAWNVMFAVVKVKFLFVRVLDMGWFCLEWGVWSWVVIFWWFALGFRVLDD